MKSIKKSIIVLSTIILYCFQMSATGTISGTIFQTTVNAEGMESSTPVSWVSATIAYVNGGITCTYPSGLFTQAPTVTVGIQRITGTYTGTDIVSHEITSNSATSTTIRVNLGSLLSLVEAATGTVNVNIWAVGT